MGNRSSQPEWHEYHEAFDDEMGGGMTGYGFDPGSQAAHACGGGGGGCGVPSMSACACPDCTCDDGRGTPCYDGAPFDRRLDLGPSDDGSCPCPTDAPNPCGAAGPTNACGLPCVGAGGGGGYGYANGCGYQPTCPNPMGNPANSLARLVSYDTPAVPHRPGLSRTNGPAMHDLRGAPSCRTDATCPGYTTCHAFGGVPDQIAPKVKDFTHRQVGFGAY